MANIFAECSFGFATSCCGTLQECGPSAGHIDQSVRTSVYCYCFRFCRAVKAELITDIIDLARATLMYPLLETVALKDDNVDGSPLAKGISKVLDDDFTSFAHALLASYDAGEVSLLHATLAAEADAAVVNWLHDLGEALGRTKGAYSCLLVLHSLAA